MAGIDKPASGEPGEETVDGGGAAMSVTASERVRWICDGVWRGRAALSTKGRIESRKHLPADVTGHKGGGKRE